MKDMEEEQKQNVFFSLCRQRHLEDHRKNQVGAENKTDNKTEKKPADPKSYQLLVSIILV